MQEVKLPQLGQSVEEASIVEWRKNEGDAVSEGEVLYTVQTDKAEIECESPVSGTLRKILVEPDVEVPVLSVVALVGGEDEALPDLSKYGSSPKAVPAAAPAAPQAESAPAQPAPTAAATQEKTTAGAVSPRAKRTAAEHGIDATSLQGTGAGGRVIEADVQAHAAAIDNIKITPTARRVAANAGLDITRVTGTGPGGKIVKEDVEKALAQGATKPSASPAAAPGEQVKLTPMRRIIAERMVESKFSAPHYYVTMEIDMAKAVAYRAGSKGFKPSYNDILLYAVAHSLRKHPLVNARWGGDAIDVPQDVNLGFAVALPTGLVVPVIHQVQKLSLEGVHEAARTLVDKAKNNKLQPDDFTGSTFTVSNLGSFGVDQFTAIINQPNSAILAAGRIKEKPVVIDGGIHVRPMMNLTLSSDHRVIDGAVAAQFLATLRKVLEEAAF